jgi:hypothetical protein
MPPWAVDTARSSSSSGGAEALYARLRAAALATGADAPFDGVAAARVLEERTLPSGRRYLAVLHARADGDTEVLELLLLPDAVCFRLAGAARRRDAPGCAGRGCINGPAQRGRLEALRDALDVSPLETDEDKRWVPLLLH